jgi:hypothetical protein
MHHVRRRDFVDLLGSAAAWSAVAFAQSPERVRRVGVLMTYAEDDPNGQIQRRSVALAALHRLPSIYPFAFFATKPD